MKSKERGRRMNRESKYVLIQFYDFVFGSKSKCTCFRAGWKRLIYKITSNLKQKKKNNISHLIGDLYVCMYFYLILPFVQIQFIDLLIWYNDNYCNDNNVR